jgi:branched-chain amino acid transport system permease protein
MIFGVILVLMMIFRPQGILPARRRQRELAAPALHDDAPPGGRPAGPAGAARPAEVAP